MSAHRVPGVAVPEMTTDEYVADTLATVPARRSADGFVGTAPDWFGDRLFGGFLLGQATSAVGLTAPEGSALHSLHAYFVAGAEAGVDIDYAIRPIRDGRSFSTRLVEATQDGRPVFTMTASFTTREEVDPFVYGRPRDPGVPHPDTLERDAEEGPWDGAEVGPSASADDGHLDSSARRWFRFARPLAVDDARTHEWLLAYLTDMTGRGARPLDLDSDMSGIISLDHAAWFHRPVPVDQWLFYDIESTINAGGRGFLRGEVFDEAGLHVASVSQETLLPR